MNNEINNSSNNSDLENSKKEIDLSKTESLIKEVGSIEEEISETMKKINNRQTEILQNDPIYTELSGKLKDLEVLDKVKKAEKAISSREFEKFLDEKLDWDAIHKVTFDLIEYRFSNGCKDSAPNTFWIIIDDPLWRDFKVDQESSKYVTGLKVTNPSGVEKEVVLGEDRITDTYSYREKIIQYDEGNPTLYFHNFQQRNSEESLVKIYEDPNQIDEGVYYFLKMNHEYSVSDKESLVEFFMRHPEILKHYISVE